MSHTLSRHRHLSNLILVLFVSFCALLSSCSTGVDDLHTNQGPGVYDQDFDVYLSEPCRLTFKTRTMRYEAIRFNQTPSTTREIIHIETQGKHRFRIVSSPSETGLEVTLEIEPLYPNRLTEVQVHAVGNLNGNPIHRHTEQASLRRQDASIGVVMGLGEFAIR